MLRLGLRMLGRQEDAEDAVQTAFLKLYRGLVKFEFGAKLSTYLFRIMINVCLDALRRRKTGQTPAFDEEPFARAPNIELRLQLEEAIAALPERMRACFLLFAVEEMKQTDIAEILDLSVGAVKSHIFHAKSRLRLLLAETEAKC